MHCKEIIEKTLRIDSYDAIFEFDRLCFPTDYWNESDWKDLLKDDRATYYCLMDGSQIIGSIFTYNWAGSGKHNYLKIMNVAVHPDYRRTGLGHKLMDYAYKEYKESGLDKICAETRASNTAMQGLFEKCGYQINKIEEGYYTSPNEAGFKYVLEQNNY